ncbi:hypothetical protein CY0110_17752 [Crocosphaera chwakensis CCY0110]|uniref:Uncharacterized protein n=1 Tax=Crocosphaera chwakensis CCY0110 TaxID=391612 RepID=A3IIN2_9CHRO|nr:hypothetical protein CY0110_17752 [Crocosphaera chwakensis CCY0110]
MQMLSFSYYIIDNCKILLVFS